MFKIKESLAIPHCGIVRAVDVRRHRYLRDHGLPHSQTMAAVILRGEVAPHQAAIDVASIPALAGAR